VGSLNFSKADLCESCKELMTRYCDDCQLIYNTKEKADKQEGICKSAEVSKMNAELFWEEYDEMKDAVEHIENAVSGSEIDTDLSFIEEKVKRLMKLRDE